MRQVPVHIYSIYKFESISQVMTDMFQFNCSNHHPVVLFSNPRFCAYKWNTMGATCSTAHAVTPRLDLVRVESFCLFHVFTFVCLLVGFLFVFLPWHCEFVFDLWIWISSSKFSPIFRWMIKVSRLRILIFQLRFD